MPSLWDMLAWNMLAWNTLAWNMLAWNMLATIGVAAMIFDICIITLIFNAGRLGFDNMACRPMQIARRSRYVS